MTLNKITNILAVVVGLVTAILSALEQLPEDSQWYVWVGAAIVAVVLYFTGKGNPGAKEKPVM